MSQMERFFFFCKFIPWANMVNMAQHSPQILHKFVYDFQTLIMGATRPAPQYGTTIGPIPIQFTDLF